MISVETGEFTVGQQVALSVDGARRQALRQHHSATHLLHEALRRELGDHVAQKGSLVSPDRLRFDFSHTVAVEGDALARVATHVNAEIQANTGVSTRLMTPDEARAEGAMALFGEKYGDEVRVVSMGSRDETGKIYSLELCGGTHVEQTGEIGQLLITSEEGPAAGVRRITALTGQAALEYNRARDSVLETLATKLKTPAAKVPERVQGLLDERKKLEAEIAKLRKAVAAGGSGAEAKTVAGVAFSGQVLGDIPAKDLKPMADEVRGKMGAGVVALISQDGGKASIVVAVSADLHDRLSAVDLVRIAAAAVGGKGGGGRADMAQAGGPDGDKAAEALAALEAAIAASA